MTFCYEFEFYFQVIITDGTLENSYTFNYSKDQDLNISIAESQLLVNELSNNKKFIPRAV